METVRFSDRDNCEFTVTEQFAKNDLMRLLSGDATQTIHHFETANPSNSFHYSQYDLFSSGSTYCPTFLSYNHWPSGTMSRPYEYHHDWLSGGCVARGKMDFMLEGRKATGCAPSATTWFVENGPVEILANYPDPDRSYTYSITPTSGCVLDFTITIQRL